MALPPQPFGNMMDRNNVAPDMQQMDTSVEIPLNLPEEFEGGASGMYGPGGNNCGGS